MGTRILRSAAASVASTEATGRRTADRAGMRQDQSAGRAEESPLPRMGMENSVQGGIRQLQPRSTDAERCLCPRASDKAAQTIVTPVENTGVIFMY